MKDFLWELIKLLDQNPHFHLTISKVETGIGYPPAYSVLVGNKKVHQRFDTNLETVIEDVFYQEVKNG